MDRVAKAGRWGRTRRVDSQYARRTVKVNTLLHLVGVTELLCAVMSILDHNKIHNNRCSSLTRRKELTILVLFYLEPHCFDRSR